MRSGQRVARLAALVPLLVLTACSGFSTASTPEPMTLYTCVSDTTIQPVIERFERDNPGRTVELFRAPTGQLNARVATDVRSGGLKADAIWACDPLTMQDFVDQQLVGGWTPPTEIPPEVRTPDYVGVAMLYLVTVSRREVPAPVSWAQLANPDYRDKVAVPDPSVAASALGALGYFAKAPNLGMNYYTALRGNGAEQVSTPDDVTTGVASGLYSAGMTTANSAYAALESGSPVEVTWPRPGAIGVYGPIALSRSAANADSAKAFLSYVTSTEGQTLIGSSGSYPTLPGVAGPTKPPQAPVVYPDWSSLASEKKRLLSEYRQIFGG
jgi:iron(III) transport system substrate-binding protein